MINKIKSIFVLFLILICAGCTGSSGDSVLIIDGEKISIEEYNVYLDEQIKSFEEQGGTDIWEVDFDGISAVEVAKQNAVNSLVMVKAAVSHAEQLGVSLSEEEIAEAHKRASEIPDSSSDIDLYNQIMEESAIQSKVYDKITDSYQINDNEFENYLNSYYEQNKDRFTKYTVKEIFVQSENSEYTLEDMQNIYNSIKSSADFDEAANKLSPDTPVTEQELDMSLYSDDIINMITSSSKGDFILAEDSTGYHIFNIIDISQTSVDSIREDVKSQYITEKKQEIYNAQNNSWTSSMNVEKNSSVYDTIEVINR